MKKKVSFVITDMSSGGAERVMSLIANYFVEKNIDIQILAIKSDKVIYSLDDRICFKFLGVYKNNIFKFLARIYKIRKETRDSDVIISFLWHCNVYTILATLFTNKKIIISERSDPKKEMRGKFRFFKWFRNLCYYAADKIVFQTEDARRYYRGSLYDKGIIIPNPISSNLPKVFRGQREKKLVAACRLTGQKNVSMMIKAFSNIYNEFPEYSLYIYGEGEEKKALEKIVEERKMSGAIKFLGFSNDIINEISKAKLFLTSSNFEGISNSMLEALAMGIPVVATDCPVGGAKQFIRSEINGELVPMEDIESFQIAIKKILLDDNYWIKLSNNAVNIREEISIKKIGDKWIDLL